MDTVGVMKTYRKQMNSTDCIQPK